MSPGSRSKGTMQTEGAAHFLEGKMERVYFPKSVAFAPSLGSTVS